MAFASKYHSAIIELDLNEEELYRLPPISNVSNISDGHGNTITSITIHIYHSELQDPHPIPLRLRPPRWRGTTFHLPDGNTVVAWDDPTGDPGGDRGPARDLEIELRHSDHLRIPAHGSPYPYTVLGESKWHDDLWRVWIRRRADPISPSSARRRYRIEATYTSQQPIIERRIPVSFFQNGFDVNWNEQQYLQIHVSGSNLIIGFRQDFRALYHFPPFKYQIKPYLDFNDVFVKKVHLAMEIKPRVNSYGVVERCPVVTARLDFHGGVVKYANDIGGGDFEIDLYTIPDCSIFVRFYLVCRGDISGGGFGDIEFIPVVDASELIDALPFSNILHDAIIGLINEYSEKLRAKQFDMHGYSIVGEFLRPWFAGGDYKLISLDYASNPDEAPDTDGSFRNPKGDLIVRYIGPRQAEPPGLLTDPDSQPVDDFSIPLFDFPFEEQVRISDPPIGYSPIVPGGIGKLRDINHIVILMQENRSFDTVLGYLSREHVREYLRSKEITDMIDDKVIGLAPDDHPDHSKQLNFFPFAPQNINHLLRTDEPRLGFEPVAQLNAYYPLRTDEPRLGVEPVPRLTPTAWPSYDIESPAHGADEVANQIDIESDDDPNPNNYHGHKMGGFVRSFAKRLEKINLATPEYLRLVLDYYTDKHLKTYADLAKQFGICDQWFTPFAGGTIPNRYVTLAGRLNRNRLGDFEEYNPDFKNMAPSELPTLFEYLSKHGRSWKVFEHGYSFTRFFGKHTFDLDNIVPFNDPVQGFEATARNGNLPDVTLIEPDYIELPPGSDDHAPADMKDGQDLVNRIVRALVASPQWPHTLLVITYDEHGGFYDHEIPPANDDAVGIIGSRSTMGPRVPAFVISPLVKPGRVFHRRFDHTSIGATIMRRFCARGFFLPPPSVSDRMDKAYDLREVLELDEPRTDFGPFGGWPALNPQSRLSQPRPRRPRTSMTMTHNLIQTVDTKEDFHWMLELARLFTGQAFRPPV